MRSDYVKCAILIHPFSLARFGIFKYSVATLYFSWRLREEVKKDKQSSTYAGDRGRI